MKSLMENPETIGWLIQPVSHFQQPHFRHTPLPYFIPFYFSNANKSTQNGITLPSIDNYKFISNQEYI